MVGQVTYKLKKNSSPEEGDTKIFDYKRMKAPGELTYNNLTTYFECCLRQMAHCLKDELYITVIDEIITKQKFGCLYSCYFYLILLRYWELK